MKNRWLLNLALIALVAVLAAVAYFQPGLKKEDRGTPLTALRAEDVKQIRLTRPKQPEIVLEKSGEQWRLTAPRAARASEFRVRELTRLATTSVTTRFVPEAAQLAGYGLASSVARVRLNDTVLEFGGMHPMQNNVYVRIGPEVALVPANFLRTALSSLEDLLSPNLLAESEKIKSLRFSGFILKQNEQGAWMRTPELKALGSDQVNRFVDEWRLARALVVAPAAAKPVRERVTIEVLRDGKPATIEFGVTARKPELVLVRFDEKLEYHFPQDVGDRLLELKPEPEPAPAAKP
jgi:hypothetical protein